MNHKFIYLLVLCFLCISTNTQAESYQTLPVSENIKNYSIEETVILKELMRDKIDFKANKTATIKLNPDTNTLYITSKQRWPKCSLTGKLFNHSITTDGLSDLTLNYSKKIKTYYPIENTFLKLFSRKAFLLFNIDALLKTEQHIKTASAFEYNLLTSLEFESAPTLGISDKINAKSVEAEFANQKVEGSLVFNIEGVNFYDFKMKETSKLVLKRLIIKSSENVNKLELFKSDWKIDYFSGESIFRINNISGIKFNSISLHIELGHCDEMSLIQFAASSIAQPRLLTNLIPKKYESVIDPPFYPFDFELLPLFNYEKQDQFLSHQIQLGPNTIFTLATKQFVLRNDRMVGLLYAYAGETIHSPNIYVFVRILEKNGNKRTVSGFLPLNLGPIRKYDSIEIAWNTQSGIVDFFIASASQQTVESALTSVYIPKPLEFKSLINLDFREDNYNKILIYPGVLRCLSKYDKRLKDPVSAGNLELEVLMFFLKSSCPQTFEIIGYVLNPVSPSLIRTEAGAEQLKYCSRLKRDNDSQQMKSVSNYYCSSSVYPDQKNNLNSLLYSLQTNVKTKAAFEKTLYKKQVGYQSNTNKNNFDPPNLIDDNLFINTFYVLLILVIALYLKIHKKIMVQSSVFKRISLYTLTTATLIYGIAWIQGPVIETYITSVLAVSMFTVYYNAIKSSFENYVQ